VDNPKSLRLRCLPSYLPRALCAFPSCASSWFVACESLHHENSFGWPFGFHRRSVALARQRESLLQFFDCLSPQRNKPSPLRKSLNDRLASSIFRISNVFHASARFVWPRRFFKESHFFRIQAATELLSIKIFRFVIADPLHSAFSCCFSWFRLAIRQSRACILISFSSPPVVRIFLSDMFGARSNPFSPLDDQFHSHPLR
jgi:hypothetical protein